MRKDDDYYGCEYRKTMVKQQLRLRIIIIIIFIILKEERQISRARSIGAQMFVLQTHMLGPNKKANK